MQQVAAPNLWFLTNSLHTACKQHLALFLLTSLCCATNQRTNFSTMTTPVASCSACHRSKFIYIYIYKRSCQFGCTLLPIALQVGGPPGNTKWNRPCECISTYLQLTTAILPREHWVLRLLPWNPICFGHSRATQNWETTFFQFARWKDMESTRCEL